jgi:hypothetical protein
MDLYITLDNFGKRFMEKLEIEFGCYQRGMNEVMKLHCLAKEWNICIHAATTVISEMTFR